MKTTAAILIGALCAALLAFGRPALSQETALATTVSAATTTAPPAAATPAAAPKKDDRSSYFVLKGGSWSMSDEDVKDPDTGTYWELAYGGKFNPFIGAEFGIGYMSTEGKFLFTTTKVHIVPVNLSLRFGIPIAMVEPYILLGGGVYLTKLEVGSASTSTANLGYHSGLGVDVNLGAFVVGLEGRYFVMKGEALGTTVDLDGSTVALKAGFRF